MFVVMKIALYPGSKSTDLVLYVDIHSTPTSATLGVHPGQTDPWIITRNQHLEALRMAPIRRTPVAEEEHIVGCPVSA